MKKSAEKTETKNEEKNEESWGEVFRTVLWALLIAFIFRTFLFQPFHIPSGSMKDTLLIGDFVIVSQYSYGYSQHSFPFVSLPLFDGRIWYDPPKRGDIVVFKVPERNSGEDVFIKRVVGMPGDRVQMRGGRLYINGQATLMDEAGEFSDNDEGTRLARYVETLPEGQKYNILDEGYRLGRDDTEVYQVPEGHFFMMGDNRDNSNDSRFPELGFVPEENLIGKAQIIMFSSEGWLLNPTKWRAGRFFVDLYE